MGRREAYGWQSLAGRRSRREAVNKAAQAPLVPRGGGPGPSTGLPPGEGWTQGSSQQEEKSEHGAEPLTYTRPG